MKPEQANQWFDEFWTVYPRHIAKEYCRRKFRRLNLSRERFDRMLAWIAEAKQSRQWSIIDFVPYPGTFLNQERWEGDLPPKKKPPPAQPPQAPAFKCPECRDTGRLVIIRNREGFFHCTMPWTEELGKEHEIRRCDCRAGISYINLLPFLESDYQRTTP